MKDFKFESIESTKMNSMSFEEESVENNDDIVKNSPFTLEWLFGFNTEVPLINLTNNSSSKRFASASGHVFQVFSCDGNKMQSFIGHENEIFALETEATGRFILSADKSGIINIWDISIASDFPHPIRTIYEPYSPEHQRKLSKVALSLDGKSVVTASDGRGSLIKLWQWSYGVVDGVDNANDCIELSEKYDRVVNIRFSGGAADSSMLVVSTKNGIIFGQWEKKSQKLLRHFPARAISISFQFLDTIFIESSHNAMSITACGSVVVWSDVLISSEYEDDIIVSTGSFKKEFLKNIKLSDNSLSTIQSIDGYIMLCDTVGRIDFYDKDLKILFWCPSYDSVDHVITISFDLKGKAEEESDACIPEDNKSFSVRDFFIQTKNDILAVDVSQMKFNKIFYRSDDFITAFDLYPNRSLVCCANYSGRIFIYDYEKKKQIAENQLKLQKRKSNSSDTDIIAIPHVSALSFSPDGQHLLCGLENGILISLDPNILHELKSFSANHDSISVIKFSPDSTFVAIYDQKSTVIVLYHDNLESDGEEWRVLGRVRYHTKAICNVLYISPSTTSSHITIQHKLAPRLISLAQDRQIVEYDLTESTKESRGLVITFVKRIFQSALPVSMTLIYNVQKRENQLLVADSEMKFKLFDINTFEILATFLGPIYDSYVKQFDANTLITPTTSSKFLIFSSDKSVCLYASPIDGNPFRSLGIVGHCGGVKHMKTNSSRKILFTIGNKCRSLFMWRVNFRPLLDHLEEGGDGLRPYCNLLPGGKFGFFFQQMQNLYFYMLILSNNNSIDDQKVNEGLDVNEVSDYMRGLGFFPSDYLIECLHHELQISGKRKVPFEDLVKLFINYSQSSTQDSLKDSLEASLKKLCFSSQTERIMFNKKELTSVLIENAEKVDEKDAEIYLKSFFRNSDNISLTDFVNQIQQN